MRRIAFPASQTGEISERLADRKKSPFRRRVCVKIDDRRPSLERRSGEKELALLLQIMHRASTQSDKLNENVQ